jgi:hypothetical protein
LKSQWQDGFSFFIICILPLFGCHLFPDKNPRVILDSSAQRGKLLAVNYCQTCHQLPDPALLDKETWVRKVLPGMAPRLGVFIFKGHEYPSKVEDLNVGRKFYPPEPLVSDSQWQDIIDYFWVSAPDSLPYIRRTEKIESASSFFHVQVPETNRGSASTCMVYFDISSGRKNILTSTLVEPGIYRYNASGKLLDSIATRGPVVDMIPDHEAGIACNIGWLNPTDARIGSIENIPGGWLLYLL